MTYKPGVAQDEFNSWINTKYAPITPSPMSDETRHRLRFRHNYKSFEQYNLSDASKYVFSLYQKLIPPEVAQKLHWLLNFHVNDTYSSLSDLSNMMRKYQTDLDHNWWYFVDLATLNDYVPAGTDKEVEDAVSEWISGDVVHEFDDGGFDAYFEQGCDVFLRSGSQHEPAYYYSSDEFLSDPMMWATPGTSDSTRLHFEWGGVHAKARKSKWATACSIDKKELHKMFYEVEPQTNKAVTKRELTKPRMIIAGDMANYLRMSYVSTWLEKKLSNHPNTTLFFSKRQMLQLWTDMIDRVTEGKLISLPIDESKYDHYVTKKMITIMFKSIRKYIDLWAPPNMQDLLTALDSTEKSLFHHGAHIFIPGTKRMILWEKGLLSGWRWTALLNTIANVAKMYAYRMKMQERLCLFNELGDPVRYDVAQGDDIDAAVTNVEQGDALLGMYKETGFVLNPKKLFVSNYSDEYLRQLATKNRLQGYPARGVASLCFRNPITSEMKVGEERLRELASNWLLCSRRCGTSQSIIESLMTRDLANANGLSKSDVHKYIHAPSTSGGLGLEPYNGLTVKLIKSRLLTPKPRFKPPPLLSTFPSNLQPIIEDIWTKGVEYGPKYKPKYSRFSLKFDRIPYPGLWRISSKAPSFSNTFEPLVRQDVLPSIVAAYRERTQHARMAEIECDAPEWLSPTSIAMLRALKPRSSIGFIKSWLSGSLPFHTPEDWRQGPNLTAPVFNEVKNNAMAIVMSSSNITKRLVLKAAFTAEFGTKRYVNMSTYVYTN